MRTESLHAYSGQVCRAASGVLCEHCLSSFVISENPIQNICTDAAYVAQNCAIDLFIWLMVLPSKGLKSIRSVPRIVAAKKCAKHVHLPNQQVCERCIGTLASTGFVSLDEAKEWMLVAFRAVGLLCEMIAIFVIGIFMICATFFPNMLHKKTDAEIEAERRAAATKNRDFAEQRKQFHSWSDEQNAFFAKRKEELYAWHDEEDDRFAKKQKTQHDAELEERDAMGRYNRTVDKIHHAVVGNEVLDVGNALSDDDQKVAKVNNVLKAVEDNKADPNELQKLADELLESRRELNRKDARRRQLFADYQDKEWSANRMFRDADAKAREGKYREAEDLARKADGLWRDATGIYNEFKSV